VWPKAVSLTPERTEVFVHRPGEEEVSWFRGAPDLNIFLDDGEAVGPLLAVVQALIRSNMPTIIEQIDLRNIAESMDCWFTLEVGPPWTLRIEGVEHHLSVQWEEDGQTELHRIDHLRIVGKAKIDVAEIPLSHRRLGEVMYSYGEGSVGGRDALLLVTESEAGGQATIRVRPEAPKPPSSGDP
jgi:hypothetical protein